MLRTETDTSNNFMAKPNLHSYEDWGVIESMPPGLQPITEALDPARMVAWYNRQTQEIAKRLEGEEGPGGNKDSAQKLRTFLNTWTDPKFVINSSLNIEAFDGLAAAAKQYAESDFDWKHHAFLNGLYTNLTQAVASLESSGAVGRNQEEQPEMGGGGPPSTDFGPSGEEPGAPENAPGETPAAPNEPGAPEEEEEPLNPNGRPQRPTGI